MNNIIDKRPLLQTYVVSDRDADGNIPVVFLYDDMRKKEITIKKGSIYQIDYIYHDNLNMQNMRILDIRYIKAIDQYELVCDASLMNSSDIMHILIEAIRYIYLIEER